MAIKPIINIDIDPDDKLGEFVQKYKAYKKALDETPGVWQNAADQAKGASASFGEILASLLAILDVSQKVKETVKQQGNWAGHTVVSWKAAAGWSKQFAANVAGATLSLARWAGIGDAIVGLVGFGSIYGLERFAGFAGDRRRSTLGLGLSYGEQQAFGVDFGRVVDTNSFLGGISEALGDVTKRSSLFRAGLTPGEMGGDTAQVGLSLLQHIKAIADRTPRQFLGQAVGVYGLGQFGIGVEDLRRLRSTPENELQSYYNQYLQNKNTLGLSDATLKKWQDLDVALTRSKTVIETALIDGLAPLTPELEKLSKSFAGWIDAALHSKEFRAGVVDATLRLRDFALWLGNKKTQDDMKTFATNVALVAQKTVDVLKALGVIPSSDNAPPTPLSGRAARARALGQHVDYAADSMWNDNPNRPFSWWDPGSWLSKNGGLGTTGMFRSLEIQNKLPPGLLDSVWNAETRRGQGNMVSRSGALGHFQLMPGTARQYGVHNPFDLMQASPGTARYLADLEREFHGSVREAIAAYNWGPGNVERDVARHGKDWDKHLPRETAEYLAKVLRGLVGSRLLGTKAEIKILDRTGGNIVVNASQLPR